MSTRNHIYSLVLEHIFETFDEILYCSLRQVNRHFARTCRQVVRKAAIIVPLRDDDDLLHLPSNLISLSLQVNSFCDVELLPRNLQNLSLEGEYNQPFVARHLPASLFGLTLGSQYRLRLNISNFPPLKELHLLASEYTHQLDLKSPSLQFLESLILPHRLCPEADLPRSLRKVIYFQETEMSHFSADDLPRTLESFVVKKHARDYKVDLAGLPPTIRTFVARGLSQKDEVDLPASLTDLKLAFCFSYPAKLRSLHTLVNVKDSAKFCSFLQQAECLEELKIRLIHNYPEPNCLCGLSSVLPATLRKLSLINSEENYNIEAFPSLVKLKLINYRGTLSGDYPATLRSFTFLYAFGERQKEINIPHNLRKLAIGGYFLNYREDVTAASPELEVFRQLDDDPVPVDQLPRGLRELQAHSIVADEWSLFPRHLQKLKLKEYLDRTDQDLHGRWDNFPAGLRQIEIDHSSVYDINLDGLMNLPLLEKFVCPCINDDDDDDYDDLVKSISELAKGIPNYRVHPDNMATRQVRLDQFLRKLEELPSNQLAEEEKEAYRKHGIAMAIPECLELEYENYLKLLEVAL